MMLLMGLLSFSAFLWELVKSLWFVLFGTSAPGRSLFPALLPRIFELLGTFDVFEASVLSFLHGSARQLHLVTVFDQKIINEGRLHYIQSISNQSSDSFIFDVTNGISSLDDLVFHLTILPKNIYMETRDLVVTEGKDVTLEPSNVHVITDYFVDKINDYLIVDPPTGGRLVEVNNEGHEVLPSVTIFMSYTFLAIWFL